MARQQEAKIAALEKEVTQLKEWVANLTFQNNLYHINSITAAKDNCDCTLLGALNLESPTSVPSQHSPPTSITTVPEQKTPIKNPRSDKNFKKDQAFISRMTKTLTRLDLKYTTIIIHQ